jgi:hypothetical protein
MCHFHLWCSAESATILSRVTGIDIPDNKRVVESMICNPWVLGPLLDYVYE